MQILQSWYNSIIHHFIYQHILHSHIPWCPGTCLQAAYIISVPATWISLKMKRGIILGRFEYCKMWGVVSGMETRPLPGLQLDSNIWDNKDRLMRVILSKSVKSELVIKIAGTTSLKEAWTLLESEYSQTRSGSLMLWFRWLTRQLSPGSDISVHISSFQEAIHHLTNADFQIPSYIAVTILLSTLPSDLNDPASWNNHISGVKIDKLTTTLSSVITGILEEKCWLTKDEQATLQKH